MPRITLSLTELQLTVDSVTNTRASQTGAALYAHTDLLKKLRLALFKETQNFSDLPSAVPGAKETALLQAAGIDPQSPTAEQTKAAKETLDFFPAYGTGDEFLDGQAVQWLLASVVLSPASPASPDTPVQPI